MARGSGTRRRRSRAGSTRGSRRFRNRSAQTSESRTSSRTCATDSYCHTLPPRQSRGVFGILFLRRPKKKKEEKNMKKNLSQKKQTRGVFKKTLQGSRSLSTCCVGPSSSVAQVLPGRGAIQGGVNCGGSGAGGAPTSNDRPRFAFRSQLQNSVVSGAFRTAESSQRFAQSVALQNALDRPHPTPVQPFSNTNGILNRGLSLGAGGRVVGAGHAERLGGAQVPLVSTSRSL